MPTKIPIKRIILTIFGIVVFQTAFCQENYLTGYVIRNSGDTLHGFVDYQNWGNNPEKIFFKDMMGDKKVSYTPIEIKQFGVRDEIYVSATVEAEVSTDNFGSLDHDNVLRFETKTIFLQTMIKGSKSLYYFNNFGKPNFYIRQDSVYELLIHKAYLKEVGGVTVFAENKTYLNQLSLYLKDCATIESKFKDADYTTGGLEKLFQYYYECTLTGMKFQKKREKIGHEYGVLAGLTMTSLDFKSETYNYLVKANFNRSLNFTAGLYLDLILPRVQGKLSLHNEFVFTSYKVKGSFEMPPTSANQHTNTFTSFAYSYLKIINLLRYKYPIGNLFVYINAGISNGFAISETNHLKLEEMYYTTPTVSNNKAISYTRKYEQGYVLGLGTKFKKYSFEFRYEKGNGMSDFFTLLSVTTRYNLMLGYRL